VPGSLTLVRRRWETIALVIPVALSLTSLRRWSSPNSGQLSRRAEERCAADGAGVAPAVGVGASAGLLLPHAALSAQRSATNADRASKRARTSRC